MKIVLFANTDWYLWNFRRSLAMAARAAGFEVLLVSPPGEFGARFAALGLRWQPLAMERRSLNPLRELGVMWRLVRLLWRERPALVHDFTIKCAVYGALAARLAGVPARINSVDGMGYVFSSRDLTARLLRVPVRLSLRAALGGRRTRLILQNPDDVALFEHARLVDAAHVRLIPGSGVDCQRFRPHRASHRSAAPPRVLLAARLLWDKGVAEYVEAARILRTRGVAATFLLAGTPDAGNPAAVPVDTVRGWVRDGLIEWPGHVNDMAGLLASVDVAVLPSYREGLPTSMIEAAACSLPLVTCDVPGCREVVTDGVEGLLVPPRDAGALATAIARLLEDPDLRERMGQAARAKALADFDERLVIERTLAVYRELLGDGPKNAG